MSSQWVATCSVLVREIACENVAFVSAENEAHKSTLYTQAVRAMRR